MDSDCNTAVEHMPYNKVAPGSNPARRLVFPLFPIFSVVFLNQVPHQGVEGYTTDYPWNGCLAVQLKAKRSFYTLLLQPHHTTSKCSQVSLQGIGAPPPKLQSTFLPPGKFFYFILLMKTSKQYYLRASGHWPRLKDQASSWLKQRRFWVATYFIVAIVHFRLSYI